MQSMTTAIPDSAGPTKTVWGSALSPLVIGLAALLALQLLLAFGLELRGKDMTPAASQGPLLAFNPEKVTALRVQSAEGEPVLVKKTEKGWIIPSLGDLPAAEHKVTGLLTKLEGLQKGLPVATSEEALKRFKVAGQAFERKLTLEQGEAAPAILYLGDSPGFRQLFVRAEGDGAVYDVELGLFDVPDKADNWSDRNLLHLDAEKIRKLTLAGLTLEHKDDSWRLADLAKGEEQDEQAIEDKVRALANMDFLGVLKGEKEPAVSKDAAPIAMEATLTSGETIRYKLTKLAEGDDYLLEVSNRPQRFTLSKYMAEELTGLDRADLLKKTEETSEDLPQEREPVSDVTGETGSGSAEPVGKTPTSSPEERKDPDDSGSPTPQASEAPAPAPESRTPGHAAPSKRGG
jgi:hypothetical protein